LNNLRWHRWGLSAVLGVLATCVGQAPRAVQAAAAYDTAGSASAPVIERALVIHDASKGLEHLVEEFTFAAGDKPLFLLLPVPTRPTVSKLASSPFAKLASASASGSGFGSTGPEQLGGRTSGPSADAAPPEQVGRLSTSVLSANDPSALKKWLGQNKATLDATTDAWLAGYASRGFYFVALRIEPKLKTDAYKTVTETLEVSFASTLPYFPYAEPLDNIGLRLLSVWLLSSDRYVPVVLGSEEGKAHWLRPWHELEMTRPAPQDVKAMLPKPLIALLPPGPLQNTTLLRYPSYTLQHFEDQKSSRRGFGDVVLVPETRQSTAPTASAELRRLMGVLDPEVKP
jgi:hypothetical protein